MLQCHVALLYMYLLYIYIHIIYIYAVLGYAIDIHVALTLYMYLLFGGIYCLRVVLYMLPSVYYSLRFSKINAQLMYFIVNYM